MTKTRKAARLCLEIRRGGLVETTVQLTSETSRFPQQEYGRTSKATVVLDAVFTQMIKHSSQLAVATRSWKTNREA